MSESICDLVRKTENLPSLPTVAVEILRLSREDDATADQLAAVIAQDPSMTGRVLKVVNSSLFGIPREIGSLKQAVNLLGLRTVQVMVLSFSLVDTVRSNQDVSFDFESYWRRSLTNAVAARLLGKVATPRLAEEAFVAGLLADLGMIAAWRCAPRVYAPVLEARNEPERHITEVEVEQLGVTHATLGHELLVAWGLPGSVCRAVGAHHGEGLGGLSDADAELAKVVWCASMVADLFCGEIDSVELDRVRSVCLQVLRIDAARFEEVLEAIDEHVRETATMLSVQVGDTVDYVQLQAEASAQLARLSLQSELERLASAKQAEAAQREAARLHEEKRVILEVASTDGLTKVGNRAAFDKHLDAELERAAQRGSAVGLILMDVDRFKLFNDTHGHQAGDAVLRTVAQCLRNVVNGAGFVARYGGEEFAVVLADHTAEETRALAEMIRAAIESTTARHGDEELRVTASFGAACVTACDVPPSGAELIEQADRHLYQAKNRGRNRVEMS